jgi:hypothetical protein
MISYPFAHVLTSYNLVVVRSTSSPSHADDKVIIPTLLRSGDRDPFAALIAAVKIRAKPEESSHE